MLERVRILQEIKKNLAFLGKASHKHTCPQNQELLTYFISVFYSVGHVIHFSSQPSEDLTSAAVQHSLKEASGDKG